MFLFWIKKLVYIQHSHYEGKAVTIREAQLLEELVIITNYATLFSHLENGIDDIVVSMNNEDCAKGIADFIRDKKLQEKIMNNLKIRDYSNANEDEKIYQLVGENNE